jgi:hypothetical protein
VPPATIIERSKTFRPFSGPALSAIIYAVPKLMKGRIPCNASSGYSILARTARRLF